jgi:serine protease Do
MEGKMKKILIGVTTSTAVIFGANYFIKDRVEPKELIREVPNHKNGILSYHEIIKTPKKSVVNISTQKTIKARQNAILNDPFFKDFFGFGFDNILPKDRVERSLGSGVIVTSNGYIVTNNHVIDGADKVIVSLSGDKKEYIANIVGKDPKSDIAVIKIDANDLTSIEFADSNNVKEGDVVFAIGNPFGVGETVTHGIVSALNKHGFGINEYENFIQTDAPINPGNSGGALIDSRGALIGINTAIISKSGASNGIGFAIPSNSVKSIAKSLIDNGKVERGFLGIGIQDLDAKLQKYYNTTNGSLVTSVEKDSPADKGGIKVGDVIVEVQSKKILDSADLKNKIAEITPNTTTQVKLLRNKSEIIINIKVGKNSGFDNSAIINGIKLAEVTTDIRKKYNIPNNISGVIVEDVKTDDTMLNIGDVIYRVEDVEINSIADIQKVFDDNKNEKRVFIYRNGRQFVTIVK